MKITLSYRGLGAGVSFTPILPIMFAGELKKLGFNVELVKDLKNYEYDGSPSDNIYNNNYQELLDFINNFYGDEDEVEFKDLEVNYDLATGATVPAVLTSFGCVNHCKFCPLKDVSYVSRPMDKVLNDLEYVTSKYNYFEFTDNSVLADKDRFMSIIAGIPKGVKWGALINLEDYVNTRELEIMKEHGCINIYVGVESFNPKDLEYFDKPYYKKGIDPKEALIALRMMGFEVMAFLIRGLPNQTKEELKETVKWISDNGMYTSISTLHIDGKYVKKTEHYTEKELKSHTVLDTILNELTLNYFIGNYIKNCIV
jgi:radical SAM superfamily enzyme YgiQ (UPF0313 family)